MMNKRMEEKLEAGECIDVSRCQRTEDGDYVLTEFIDDVDYCDAVREAWIWSIGRHLKTGRIIASTSSYLYMNEDYECLFLR